MSTTARELCGVVSALQTYEHYLLGSPHPIYFYTDHEALIYLWKEEVNFPIDILDANWFYHNSKI